MDGVSARNWNGRSPLPWWLGVSAPHIDLCFLTAAGHLEAEPQAGRITNTGSISYPPPPPPALSLLPLLDQCSAVLQQRSESSLSPTTPCSRAWRGARDPAGAVQFRNNPGPPGRSQRRRRE
ncbi:hypothetical protein AAFF_G00421670 [Aldrovandia affinis]|uniref:Uncharacterized protein n=1 Tax=Aldrovandia affinis TaxID=143900 RepID=A0AAD7WJU4_9TELE|nr:hypothetical protein AAFF_G00421670 [Aldrovandia affinis]